MLVRIIQALISVHLHREWDTLYKLFLSNGEPVLIEINNLYKECFKCIEKGKKLH